MDINIQINIRKISFENNKNYRDFIGREERVQRG